MSLQLAYSFRIILVIHGGGKTVDRTTCPAVKTKKGATARDGQADRQALGVTMARGRR